MSLIGPRPTLRYQVDRYDERQLPPSRRQARDHRLGADPRPRVAAVGRADRARPLVRRAPLARRRPEDPAADAARALRRHLQGRDRWLEAGWLSGRPPLAAICVVRRSCLGALERRPLPDRRRATTRGDHMAYADGLVPGWHLPQHEGEYYTPPGFYAVAGTARLAGEQDRARRPPPRGQAVNVLFLLGTVLLVAADRARALARPAPDRARRGGVRRLPAGDGRGRARCSTRSRCRSSSRRSRSGSASGRSPTRATRGRSASRSAPRQLVRAWALATVGGRACSRSLVGAALARARDRRACSRSRSRPPGTSTSGTTYGGQPQFPQPAQLEEAAARAAAAVVLLRPGPARRDHRRRTGRTR